jgi:tetratricopeptide (TPR) repeat protein
LQPARLTLHTQADNTYGVAHTLSHFGYVHQVLGQHDDAISYYNRALPLLRETNAGYWEAVTLDHMGDLYKSAGELDTARSTWQQAAAILENLRHPDVGPVRAKLGS